MRKIIRIAKACIRLPIDVWQLFITYLPGPTGDCLRYRFWIRRLKFLGKGVKLDVGVFFQNPQFISVGDNCWIDRNVLILAGPSGSDRTIFMKITPEFEGDIGVVNIGRNTHIAPNCVLSGIGGLHIGQNCGIASNTGIYSFSHHYRNLGKPMDTWQYSFTPLARPNQQSMVLGPVVIEDFCAIGLNCVILPGTVLGKGTWIGSGSVIADKYPQQTLVSCKKSVSTKSLNNLKIME